MLKINVLSIIFNDDDDDDICGLYQNTKKHQKTNTQNTKI